MFIKEGDHILLLAPDDKAFLIEAEYGKKLSTQRVI